MNVLIILKDVQHIRQMQFAIDLESRGLICITGKNGAGKTTLVKAIRNLINADTFSKTSSDGIFGPTSSIEYEVGGLKICFSYDQALGTLNCSDEIPESLRSSIAVELSIPHGERFIWYPRVSDADEDIRRSRVLENYSTPQELIAFLRDIYASPKFDQLAEVSVKKQKYYFIPLPDDKYLREDYLSSGEYFLISLYRRITVGRKLIVIDEIDISLDAAAQVRLVRNLREFSKKYGVCFVFTTHSLAMMRTLRPEELYYMDQAPATGATVIANVSYNYINSILFGFSGWDKYILTEDEVLAEFLEFVVQRFCGDLFYSYKIIYIGGGTNTTGLMQRNSVEKFLAEPADVVTVLDGDQRNKKHSKHENVHCIPLESVEKALLADCLSGDLSGKIVIGEIIDDQAALSRYMQEQRNKLGSTKDAPTGSSKHASAPLQGLASGFLNQMRRLVYFLRNGDWSFAPSDTSASENQFNTAAKKLFRHLLKQRIASKVHIFEHLTQKHKAEIVVFAATLRAFLTLPK